MQYLLKNNGILFLCNKVEANVFQTVSILNEKNMVRTEIKKKDRIIITNPTFFDVIIFDKTRTDIQVSSLNFDNMFTDVVKDLSNVEASVNSTLKNNKNYDIYSIVVCCDKAFVTYYNNTDTNKENMFNHIKVDLFKYKDETLQQLNNVSKGYNVFGYGNFCNINFIISYKTNKQAYVLKKVQFSVSYKYLDNGDWRVSILDKGNIVCFDDVYVTCEQDKIDARDRLLKQAQKMSSGSEDQILNWSIRDHRVLAYDIIQK